VPRLLQLTDSHLMDDPAGRLKGFETELGFRRCLAKGVERVRPQRLLLTGDLVHDAGRDAYERLAAHCARSGVEAYALPGNHDDPALVSEIFSGQPIDSGRHHVIEGWQIIMLDSVVPGRVGGRLRHTELAQLEEALSAHPRHHALICLHHQPIGVDSAWMDEIGLDNAEDLLAVIDRHSTVRAVLWGHIHQVFDATRNGVRYLGSPSTCIQFRPGVDRMQLDTQLPGTRWLLLDDDGGIQTGVNRWHPIIDRIVSGGQTGVDRAALDVALELGLEVGGWCPKGRRAEDGSLPWRYPLRETPEARYAQRTEWNVRDAHGTLILAAGRLSGGTALTAALTRRLGKPLLVADLEEPPTPEAFTGWLKAHAIAVLNVAGPRESSLPGAGARAATMLRVLLTGVG
jgi:Icc protein